MRYILKAIKKGALLILCAMMVLCAAMPADAAGLITGSTTGEASGFVTDRPAGDASGLITERFLGSTTYTQGTDWEKYGNYYFYNQMSAKEREFYDALNDKCLAFMLGEEDATDYVYKNTTYYLMGYVSSDSLTIPQMVQVAKIFKYNNPQYYFLSTMIFPKTSDNAISFTVYSRFSSSAAREIANARISHEIRSAISNTSLAHTEAERVLAFHNYIIDMVDYESSIPTEDTTYTQSVYSVFGNDDKKTVCAGYSGAFMMLCNAVGIDCISVTSALHQWNKVRINDTWYNIDLTADDTGLDEDKKSTRQYRYFCRSNNMVSVIDDTDYHTIEEFWTDFVLPECQDDTESDVSTANLPVEPEMMAVAPGYSAEVAESGDDQFLVSLYTATNGADIYYTTDGRTPAVGSTKSRLYTKPFKAKKNAVIRAVAVKDGFKDSGFLKVSISEPSSGGTTVRLSDCTVKLSKSKFKYTGSPIKPKVTSVTYKGTTLTEGVDYVITGFENNINAGTAKMIISSVSGSNYKGSKTVTFSISPYLLTAPVVSVKNINKGIRLSWAQVDFAKGYIIERSEDGRHFKRIKKINDVKKTAYNDTKTENGKRYYYRMTAYSAGNEYRKTYCKTILTYRILRPVITELTSEKAKNMKVSWGRDSRASGYQVKYVTGKEGRMFDVDKKYTAATITGLDAKVEYKVYVRSIKKIEGQVIYSKWSAPKKITVASASVSSAAKGSRLSSSVAGLSASAMAKGSSLNDAVIDFPAGYDIDTVDADETLKSPVTSLITSDLKGSKYYKSRWERYSSYYYYNQLNAREKKIYNVLNTQCLELLNSSMTVENVIPKNMSGNGREYFFLDPIDYEEMGASENEAMRAFRFFRYSNPQYFFIDGTQLGFNGAGIFAITIYSDFRTYEGRKAAIDAMNETIDSWDIYIDELDSDEEKVRKIHDLICERVSYNFEAVNTGYVNDNREFTQSMYSALGWPTKKTVCAGYSYAFQYLANKYGIDCVSVTSGGVDSDTGETAGGHQWNAVRIEDQWYMIDLTWDDDPLADGTIPIAYMCYLRSLKKINSLAYVQDNDENHIPESFYGSRLPKCVKDSGPTIYEPGEIYEPENRVKAPVITVNKKNKKVSLKSKTKNVTIYYTTDGTAPDPASSKSLIYKKAFKVKKGQVIRAVAVRSGYYDSKITKKKVKFT